jgi:translocation and assembly module TamA
MKKIISIILLCAGLCVMSAYALMLPELKFAVHGIDGAMRANVESRLKIEREDVEKHIDDAHVAAFAAQSVTAVKAAVAPFGYYQPEVTTSLKKRGNIYIIDYNVHPGRPVRVTSVNIKITGPGVENVKIMRAVKNFPLHEGDIFDATVYTAARDKLFDVINNQGYIKSAARETKVLVNTQKYSAQINIILQTNERYYFGKIHFKQNAYNAAFMRRFDTFAEDEPFSSDKLLQYQQEMNSSRYFRQVIVIPDMNGAKDMRVPIEASVIPINYRRYAFGLGYGTFTKFRFTAGVSFKRLTDTGQALDAQLKLSKVLSGVALKYYIPGYNPLTEQWEIGGNYQRFEPKNGISYSKSLVFGYSRKMHHWTLTGNMNYLWERYKVVKQNGHRSQLLYPSLNLDYLKTDSVVQPTYGRSLHMYVQGASDGMLSSTSFMQGEVQGKLFMSPFSFNHIILRGDLGYTVVHNLMDLPLSMRFFAGGMTTVRGYEDSSIGPGKYLGVASIEYRHHIAYDISGAAFYDIGSATNHFGGKTNQNNISDPGWMRGAGIGLVYESVVGPVRLYYSEAINKRGHPHQIEFALGPEF